MKFTRGKGEGVPWRLVLAWGLVGLLTACFAVKVALLVRIPADRLGGGPNAWPVNAFDAAMLFYGGLGGLLALRRPRNPIGWIFLAVSAASQINGLTSAYVAYTEIVTPGVPLLPPGLLWLPSMLWMIPYAVAPLLLFLFPNGALPSRRWRLLVWAMAAAAPVGLGSFGEQIQQGTFFYQMPALVELLGVVWVRDALGFFFTGVYLAALVLAPVALALRYRRAQAEERLQIKWFVFAGVIAVVINLVEDLFFDSLSRLDPSALNPAGLFLGIPEALSFAIVGAAVAVAVLRYRLYEIDIILRKTLIYATLTVLLALVYAAGVILLETLLAPLTGQAHSSAAVVLSTLAIATLFTPLRRRVQRGVDQRFFRRRYNADQVLARFTVTARDAVDLERISDSFLSVVTETMQPEQVSLWIRPEKRG